MSNGIQKDERAITLGEEAKAQLEALLANLYSSVQDSDLNPEYKNWHGQQVAAIFQQVQRLHGANAVMEDVLRQMNAALAELQWQRQIAISDLALERQRSDAHARQRLVEDIAEQLNLTPLQARWFLDIISGSGTVEVGDWTMGEIVDLAEQVGDEIASEYGLNESMAEDEAP